MQKHVNLVDLVKSFPANIFLQNLASIQKRTSPVKFAHLAEKSGKGSISNLSTKVLPDAMRTGLVEDTFRVAVDQEGHHSFRSVFARPPRHTDSVTAMERVVNNAGRFVRALHTKTGVPVRGVHSAPESGSAAAAPESGGAAAAPPRVERFDRRGTEPFEPFRTIRTIRILSK